MLRSRSEMGHNSEETSQERRLIISGLPLDFSEALLRKELVYAAHVVEIRFVPEGENGNNSLKAIITFENHHFATEQQKLISHFSTGAYVGQNSTETADTDSGSGDNSEERRSRRGKRRRGTIVDVPSSSSVKKGTKRSNHGISGPDSANSGNQLSSWIKEKQSTLRVPLTAEAIIARVEALGQQNQHQAAYIYFLEHMELVPNKEQCEKKLNELLSNVRQHWLSLSPRIAGNAQISTPIEISFESGHLIVQKKLAESPPDSSTSSHESASYVSSISPPFNGHMPDHLLGHASDPSQSQLTSPEYFESSTSFSSTSSPAVSPPPSTFTLSPVLHTSSLSISKLDDSTDYSSSTTPVLPSMMPVSLETSYHELGDSKRQAELNEGVTEVPTPRRNTPTSFSPSLAMLPNLNCQEQASATSSYSNYSYISPFIPNPGHPIDFSKAHQHPYSHPSTR